MGSYGVHDFFSLFCLGFQGDIGGQFIAAPPTCPNETFSFMCTVDFISRDTIWRVGGGSECILGVLESDTCGPGGVFTATSAIHVLSHMSTLSGIATMALDGTLVECFAPSADDMIGKSVLQIVGQYVFKMFCMASCSYS